MRVIGLSHKKPACWIEAQELALMASVVEERSTATKMTKIKQRLVPGRARAAVFLCSLCLFSIY